MIVKEFFETRFDGVKLYITYSNKNFYIRQIQTGNIYVDAIDVENAQYTYEETEKLVPKETFEKLQEAILETE